MKMVKSRKSWLLGYENWAIPCEPQYHIGPYSNKIQQRTSYRYRQYDSTGSGKVGIGILSTFYALAGEDGKQEAIKAAKGLAQYGIDPERDWDTAKSYAEEDWQWMKQHQKITLKELLETKPFNTDWDSWKPNEEIKRSFHLSNIVSVPG